MHIDYVKEHGVFSFFFENFYCSFYAALNKAVYGSARDKYSFQRDRMTESHERMRHRQSRRKIEEKKEEKRQEIRHEAQKKSISKMHD